MSLSKKAISVCFEDLSLDDDVIIWDRDHNAHGSSGTIYHIDTETRMISVVTKNMADTWEGMADGLQKVIG